MLHCSKKKSIESKHTGSLLSNNYFLACLFLNKITIIIMIMIIM